MHLVPRIPVQPAKSTASTSRTNGNDTGKVSPTELPAELLSLLDGGPGTTESSLPGWRNPQTASFDNALGVLANEGSVSSSPLPPPEPPDEPKPPVRTGGHLQVAVLLDRPSPIYPPLARTARVEGVVVLRGTILLNGRIGDIQVVSGNAMLIDAAVECVKKWRYQPAILNGQTVTTPIDVKVEFKLRYPGL